MGFFKNKINLEKTNLKHSRGEKKLQKNNWVTYSRFEGMLDCQWTRSSSTAAPQDHIPCQHINGILKIDEVHLQFPCQPPRKFNLHDVATTRNVCSSRRCTESLTLDETNLLCVILDVDANHCCEPPPDSDSLISNLDYKDIHNRVP